MNHINEGDVVRIIEETYKNLGFPTDRICVSLDRNFSGSIDFLASVGVVHNVDLMLPDIERLQREVYSTVENSPRFKHLLDSKNKEIEDLKVELQDLKDRVLEKALEIETKIDK